MRGYQSNPKFLKSKVANSQSPIQKKRLLEFATQNLRNDKSMQGLSSKGALNPQTSNSTKVIDFRREIDRRFQNSLPNQIYVFPRTNQDMSSSGDSFDSLRDLGEYDLHTQDFKKSILLERERASVETKDKKLKNRSFESPPQQQLNTARDYYVNPKVASIKNKRIETDGATQRETSKGPNDSGDFPTGTACKKFIKMPSPKAQRAVVLTDSNQKARQENNSVGSRKLEHQTSQRSNIEISSKTINLNVNVNMNIDYRDSKDGNSRSKMSTSPPTNAECFINCNFFPKTLTHGPKDLKINTSKSPTTTLYKNIELKTLQNGNSGSKPMRKGATPTTSSTADKSLTNKSSYSLMQNDIEKTLRPSKTRELKSKKSNNSNLNGNILSSSLRRDGSSTSRGEESKIQGNLKATTLYQKAQNDILKKLKVPESLNDFTSYGQLHNFVTNSHTMRSTLSQDKSKRAQSPQVNNFFIPTTTSLKMASKNSTLTKSSKDLLVTERVQSLNSKEVSSKSKTREDEIAKYLDSKKSMEKGEGKKELSMTQRINKEKSKMKMNLHGLTQRLGSTSDRAGTSIERNEQKNKSHAEYFR